MKPVNSNAIFRPTSVGEKPSAIFPAKALLIRKGEEDRGEEGRMRRGVACQVLFSSESGVMGVGMVRGVYMAAGPDRGKEP